MAIRVFGLTGGIGSGKSTVARRFAALGLPVIDADALAREVVEPETEGLAAVVAAFGTQVLTEHGTLDRKRLGEAVFADPEQRQRLNSILHPLIRQRFASRVQMLEQRGERLACYEVPLLFEVGLEQALAPVVVVSAPEALQVARIMQRDGLDEAAARARIAAQLPLADKAKRAEYVIDNSGDVDRTYAQADRVLAEIRAALAPSAESA